MTNEFKGKKVVITGGLGFIGSNLAETLVDLGANVFLVDSMLPSYGGNEFNIARIKDKVSVSFTDLRDKHALPFIVKNSDYIFNLAMTWLLTVNAGVMGALLVLRTRIVLPRARRLHARCRMAKVSAAQERGCSL